MPSILTHVALSYIFLSIYPHCLYRTLSALDALSWRNAQTWRACTAPLCRFPIHWRERKNDTSTLMLLKKTVVVTARIGWQTRFARDSRSRRWNKRVRRGAYGSRRHGVSVNENMFHAL